MWFLGFPISMILGGVFYSAIGPKLIMQIALIAHAIGILMTISGIYLMTTNRVAKDINYNPRLF
jgi:uncharacterized membrane protein HdeD (DUF308 family)